MKYWLMKSEPETYSFSDLLKEKKKTTFWDGVRNYQARNILRDQIKVGDRVLFYHSNAKPSCVVGTAVVVRDGYPDHTAWDPDSAHPDPKSTPDNPRWYMVDIKADKKLKSPVSLHEIKDTRGLQNMKLVSNSRLSVQPVTKKEWDIILRMGGLSAG